MRIPKFGKFETVIHKARNSQTNPQDPKGPKLYVPEKRRVKFRPFTHFSGVVEGTIDCQFRVVLYLHEKLYARRWQPAGWSVDGVS